MNPSLPSSPPKYFSRPVNSSPPSNARRVSLKSCEIGWEIVQVVFSFLEAFLFSFGFSPSFETFVDPFKSRCFACRSYLPAVFLHHVSNLVCLNCLGVGSFAEGGTHSTACGAGRQKKVAARRSSFSVASKKEATLCVAAGNASRVILAITLPVNTVATAWP